MCTRRYPLVLVLVVLLSLWLVRPGVAAQESPPESDLVGSTDVPADPPADESAEPAADVPAELPAEPPADVPAEAADVPVEEPAPPVEEAPIAVVDEPVVSEPDPAAPATEPAAAAPAEAPMAVSTEPVSPEPEAPAEAADPALESLALSGEEGESLELLSVEDAPIEAEAEQAIAAITAEDPSATVQVALVPGLVLTEDTPENVVAILVGSGITYQNITYAGAPQALGQFTGGTGIIGFDAGIILSTGNIGFAVGPNEFDDVTAVNDQPGDPDLEAIEPGTQDAAVLTFEFVPEGNTVTFEYVFASDEYPEYVGSEFNDTFAFFINGTNCATIDGGAVSINTVNGGENAAYFIDNEDGHLDTEMDGMTVVLTCTASVNAGEVNTIKLAIADRGDMTLDSNVFIRAQSFTVPTPEPTTPPATEPPGKPGETPADPADPASESPSTDTQAEPQALTSEGGTSTSAVVTGMPNTGAGSPAATPNLAGALLGIALVLFGASRATSPQRHRQ